MPPLTWQPWQCSCAIGSTSLYQYGPEPPEPPAVAEPPPCAEPPASPPPPVPPIIGGALHAARTSTRAKRNGARVLTDPVWGERISPVRLVGPKRFQPVPVTIDQLPKLDAVIVSHDHYDHLDKWTIERLAKLDVPFFTSLGVGAHLECMG